MRLLSPNSEDPPVSVAVDRSSLTDGTGIVEGKLDGKQLRIHAGGSGRLELLNAGGSRITCALGNLSLIRRESGDPMAQPNAQL